MALNFSGQPVLFCTVSAVLSPPVALLNVMFLLREPRVFGWSKLVSALSQCCTLVHCQAQANTRQRLFLFGVTEQFCVYSI
jgi:hypothetical protein